MDDQRDKKPGEKRSRGMEMNDCDDDPKSFQCIDSGTGALLDHPPDDQ